MSDTGHIYIPSGALIPVDARAFNELWHALNGAEYRIRELQTTRSIDALMAKNPDHKPNPLNVLAGDYETWFKQFAGKKTYLWIWVNAHRLNTAIVDGVEHVNTSGPDSEPLWRTCYFKREDAVAFWEATVSKYATSALMCFVADDYVLSNPEGPLTKINRKIEASDLLSEVQIFRAKG